MSFFRAITLSLSSSVRLRHGFRKPISVFPTAQILRSFSVSVLTPAFQRRLDSYLSRHNAINASITAEGASMKPDQIQALSKELSRIGPLVRAGQRLKELQRDMEEITKMISDAADDMELRKMAKEELQLKQNEVTDVEQDLVELLIPKDEADPRDIVLEVRAGAGGQEASLFAMDVFRMYERFADLKGWNFEVLSESQSELGGYKEATAGIKGTEVFGSLKFESGVHRVQRVPITEAAGRVHTSTVTVSVLPEAEESDVTIHERDLRIDVYRSQGAGGQSVNKTESAVRITHIPTGLVVAIQEEKSQHRNRARAMTILRARLYEQERAKREAARAAARNEQVGTGDRSEKIRTYNFAQGRITDHRVGLTLHGLDSMLNGELLDEFSEALRQRERKRALDEVANSSL